MENMNWQQAYDYGRGLFYDITSPTHKFSKYNKICLDAIKLQIPKGIKKSKGKLYCLNCNKEIETNIDFCINYCYHCGQNINIE